MKKLLLTGIGALLLAGCATDGRSPHVGVGVSVEGSAPPSVIVEAPRSGPPPWALTDGRRAKEALYHHYYYYHYYPASGVYLNVSTGSYFYLNGGSWQAAMTLPSTLMLDTRNYVSLALETDRPYLYYDEHKIKYNGYGRSKGHGHGEGHWHDKD